ncbi:hypothetical protein ACIQGZ_01775 [Streptomyces sp. NPDC092296]|uniref:hypothetical protein n=1 Tax=Streptomyces sp. NPDC092296 TaxID=3366012 RepID=UPI0037F5CFB1
MAQSDYRTDVMDLLFDADFKYRPDTNTWSHSDGSPFTRKEQATVLSATREEFETFCWLRDRKIERDREMADATQAVIALLHRYFAVLPADSTAADAAAVMTEQDRTEYERLLDIVAPDGWLFAPSEE